MKVESTLFSRALADAIDRLYAGNKAALGRESGIPGPTLYTLCAAKVSPSHARLRALAKVLPAPEARRLLLAAAKDTVPPELCSAVVSGGDFLAESRLAPALERVLRFLESEAAEDPEVAGMLRSIGRWAGVLDDDGVAMVAEDEDRYDG